MSKPRRINRILIVRTDRLGDVILTLPMLAAIRRCFPDAYIAMLLRRYTGEIVEGNPHVDELIWYDDVGNLLPFKKMRQILREKLFDAAVVVYPRLRLAWLMFTAGIPVRIGTGYRYYSMLFNRRAYEHRRDAKRHEVEYNLNLLNQLGCPAVAEPLEFHISIPDEAHSTVQKLLQTVNLDPDRETIVIHPGSGGSAREWPAEYFGVLASRLVAERGAQILVTGGRGEERKVAEVLLATQGLAIPLVNKLSLKELAALLRSASLFISNSTGPLHLAVAAGTPVVGLFPQITALSAQRWGPYTQNKRVLVPDKPITCTECVELKAERCACMQSITVEQTFRATCSILDENRVRQQEKVSGHA